MILRVACSMKISLIKCQIENQTSCRRAAARICPRPTLPPWAPKRLALPSWRQRSNSFPRPIRSHAHRCSRLTRQHGGKQSAWWPWPLAYWRWKWCPSHVWRGLPLCQFSVPSLLGLYILDLGPMYATDRQTSDVRQHDSFMPSPIRGRGIKQKFPRSSYA